MGIQPRDRRSAWAIAVDAATIVIALCALTVTALVLQNRRSERVASPAAADRVLSKADWSRTQAQGHLLGSAGAPVRIVEFGDYQCPFCRGEEKVLRALRAAYPHKVALLFRNYPLPYHVHAYSAARMAECAADQRRFTKAHDVLFRADLATLKASALAHAVKVPDSVRFVACSSRKDSVASIRRDIKAADELGVDGVPAVIVQGTMFRMPPDSAKLFTLVQKLIKTSPNE